MSLLNQIESNDITDLTIEAVPKEAFEGAKVDAFLDALEKNTSITKMNLKGDFLACLRGDQRSQVIKAIGKTKVQDIHLGNSLVLAPDLAELVISAKSLTRLILDDICLQGDADFMGKFETALVSHPSLKEFEMSNCMASNQSIDIEKIQQVKVGGPGGCSIENPAATANTATAKSA